MVPVNPEAIGLFGLFATVICFGLEQLGVGVKGADHEKLTRSLGYIAIFFGGFTQIFTALCMYLFSVGGDHSIYLGTVFGFFGLFWVLVGYFFIKGGAKTRFFIVVSLSFRSCQPSSRPCSCCFKGEPFFIRGYSGWILRCRNTRICQRSLHGVLLCRCTFHTQR